MKFGVVQFPGSNCDDDAHYAIGTVIGQPVEFIWHQSENVSGFDAIILPGGFAFGDYLRTGAIARFSPVMKAVGRFARAGGSVLGFATDFRFCSRRGCCRARCCVTKGCGFCAGRYTCEWKTRIRRLLARRVPGKCWKCRLRTWKETIFAMRNARGTRAQPADYFPLRTRGRQRRWS